MYHSIHVEIRKICRSWFSLSTTWVLRIKLQVIRLGSKHFYLLRYLTGPFISFLIDMDRFPDNNVFHNQHSMYPFNLSLPLISILIIPSMNQLIIDSAFIFTIFCIQGFCLICSFSGFFTQNF